MTYLLKKKHAILSWFSFCSSEGVHQGPSKVIDVTVPVQCQVKDSRLFLTESSKVGSWEWDSILCCKENAELNFC